ncbi:hypothetical protein [Actinomyces wuliandei]|uniref:hypothetical protein n=1 Tax=Actinomyces wuliandei TaxID=2057743 RepID=UPI001117D0E7|nr:hypothetical protein [Actinomyces wuliandei]
MLVLTAVSAVCGCGTALLGSTGGIPLAVAGVGASLVLVSLLTRLHERAVGAWLIFIGAVMLAVTGTLRHTHTLETVPPTLSAWVGIIASGLLAVLAVMTWTEWAEASRPSRNF